MFDLMVEVEHAFECKGWREDALEAGVVKDEDFDMAA